MNTLSHPSSRKYEATAKPNYANSPRRISILVVDDDPDICYLNSEMLLRNGYEVTAAEDGDAGWKALQVGNYDLLITDNNMPKLTGVELLAKIHSAQLALPAIMATGTLPSEEFARCPWLQPAATLIKPYTVAELLWAVKIVLGRNGDGGGQIAPLPLSPGQPGTVTS